MKVKSYKAGSVGEVEFDVAPFGDKVLYRTLKESVLSHLANKRQGNASTRGRAEVSGSNKKPYKQKHTGNARAGDRKSPIWRGGGTVFGPKPRDYSYHLPRKARRVALRTALAGKFADGQVVVADLGSWSAPSAKTARKVLTAVGGTARACVVVAERDENLHKSFRNFPKVAVRTADELCAYDIANGGIIIADAVALERLVGRVGRTSNGTEQAGGAS
ncbi:MAG: 50S ribosomal protein L4 [Planctomycetota bacterium]